jgi:hypothetical protein
MGSGSATIVPPDDGLEFATMRALRARDLFASFKQALCHCEQLPPLARRCGILRVFSAFLR